MYMIVYFDWKVFLLIIHTYFIEPHYWQFSGTIRNTDLLTLDSVIVELKDMKLQEKMLKEKCKQEDGIVSAVSLWTNEILPNWETM